MTPEEYIKSTVIKELGKKGYSITTCESVADQTVTKYKNNQFKTVSDLINDAIKSLKKR